jgi:hypothetical protein
MRAATISADARIIVLSTAEGVRMHVHIGFVEFLIFAMYYVILKALLQLLNIEARRSGSKTLAGVSGLFA